MADERADELMLMISQRLMWWQSRKNIGLYDHSPSAYIKSIPLPLNQKPEARLMVREAPQTTNLLKIHVNKYPHISSFPTLPFTSPCYIILQQLDMR